MILNLPMEHRVLAVKCGFTTSVVLCHLPTNEVTPWVTWKVDKDGFCYLGDYCHTEENARRSFDRRQPR